MTFVLLQTMWRSCGTYIWSKLRAQAQCHAYFEACHERLIAGSRALLAREFDRHLETVLRHSGVNGAYFAEFPVQDGGGVPYFKKRFCFEDYLLPVDRPDPEFDRYVGFLLEHAAASGRTPVIKCCRWGLKTGWLDRRFQPSTFYVLRSPDALFRSYWSLGGPHSYFLAGCVLIAAKNRTSDLFAEIVEAAGIPDIPDSNIYQEIAQAYAATERCEVQALRDLVLLLWAVNLQHNAAAGAHVIDIELLEESDAYRRAVEQDVSAAAGVAVSFMDVHRPLMPAAPGIVASPRGTAIARRAMNRLPSCDWRRVQAAAESQRALALLA
jgi:hypothetical protein